MPLQVSSSLPDHLSEAQRQRVAWVYRQLDVKVVSVRWWHVGADWVLLPRRLDDEFFFIPVTTGLVAQVAGQPGRVPAGACMFVCAGEEHQAKMPDGAREMRIYAIHAYLRPRWAGTLRQLVPGAFHGLADPGAAQARMARAANLLEHDPGLGQQLTEALLRDWLCTWALAGVPGQGDRIKIDARVEQALEMIHAQYAEPITVPMIARRVRLGDVQFRKLFRAWQGVSPKAYLAQYRLNQAARMLRLGVSSVKEVAHGSGFADAHYFHAAFRAHFGCTPTEYRASVRV